MAPEAEHKRARRARGGRNRSVKKQATEHDNDSWNASLATLEPPAEKQPPAPPIDQQVPAQPNEFLGKRPSGRSNGRAGGGAGRGRGVGKQRSASSQGSASNSEASPDTPKSSASGGNLSDLRYDDIPGLSAASKRAMSQVFGYEYATPVQAATIAPALAGRDILARARTGTGKTLGFVLPMLERITRGGAAARNDGSVCAVIVSPTRELASQIAVEAEKVCQFHGANIGVQLIIGGRNRQTEANKLKNKGTSNAVLVCTPGRFHDHVQSTPGFKGLLNSVSVAVLDECDRLLDMGFRDDIVKLLGYLPPTEKRQTLLFSATLPTSLASVTNLALKKDHDYINCVGEDTGAETATNATQHSVVVPADEWLYRLSQVSKFGLVFYTFAMLIMHTCIHSVVLVCMCVHRLFAAHKTCQRIAAFVRVFSACCNLPHVIGE